MLGTADGALPVLVIVIWITCGSGVVVICITTNVGWPLQAASVSAAGTNTTITAITCAIRFVVSFLKFVNTLAPHNTDCYSTSLYESRRFFDVELSLIRQALV